MTADLPGGARRGLSRREMMRASVVAGAAAWTAPMIIDSLSSPAAALSGWSSCCTLTSTITFGDFNAISTGQVLWLGAVFKLVGSQPLPVSFQVTTTALTLSHTTPNFSANLTSSVPVGTVTMSSAGACTGGTSYSGGSGWTTTGTTGCAGNMMMTAVQFVAPPGGIPQGTATTWSIRLDVLTPASNLNINWQFWTRAFNVTPLAYGSTGAKPGDDNSFGNSDQAAYPE